MYIETIHLTFTWCEVWVCSLCYISLWIRISLTLCFMHWYPPGPKAVSKCLDTLWGTWQMLVHCSMKQTWSLFMHFCMLSFKNLIRRPIKLLYFICHWCHLVEKWNYVEGNKSLDKVLILLGGKDKILILLGGNLISCSIMYYRFMVHFEGFFNFYQSLGKFNKQQNDILFFLQNRIWHFMQIVLEIICMKCQSIFCWNCSESPTLPWL